LSFFDIKIPRNTPVEHGVFLFLRKYGKMKMPFLSVMILQKITEKKIPCRKAGYFFMGIRKRE